MNTMEITKFVGAVCGSLLVFLLIATASASIFDTHEEFAAFIIETDEPAAEEAPAEEAVDVAALVAAADVSAGETQFRKCAACHKLDGTNAVGPHLDGVVGRDKSAVPDFNYSGALAEVGGAWTPENLYAFLENPKGYAPGTSMAFAGLAKSEDRADVIAYLETFSN
jgi:cytochrome c